MEQRGNKTIICAVFFLDIVEYSKKSVAGQISLKERFNAFLSIAIRDVPVADRIILDTGDGAAISFLGDIEDALQAALSVRSSLLGEGVRMDQPLLVRMGINLGPVRLVKDINGLPNIVGDGINVAQRVMGFADPGQILVSRSYFDAVSRLSHEYAGMFHYQGARTDKHVREHEVYAIGYPGDLTSTHRSRVLTDEVERTMGWHRFLLSAKRYWYDLSHQAANAERYVVSRFVGATRMQQAGFVAVIGLLLLGLLLGGYRLSQRQDTSRQIMAGAPSQVDRGVPIPASAPIAVSEASNKPEAPNKKVAKPPEKKIQGIKQSARTRTLEETTGGPALVRLSIQPWGEVYLDGKKQGVSPPLLELQVVAGKHSVEIKNSTFPVYTKKIQVKAGAQIIIRHSFK
ncbi:adenylate/guanylate cyclase domain-containing protein [Ferrigenium sp. UT5]|uniref:adenylate/guanylate cyclase domain-containing protein n=1 Tax=Ferrigenium sp. UT5 TaxID=3242105 RepID=UPI003552A96A